MIVEQTMPITDENEGNDVLAGWREVPGFQLAYIRQHASGGLEAVGLFDCSDISQKLAKRQKRVLEMTLGGSK